MTAGTSIPMCAAQTKALWQQWRSGSSSSAIGMTLFEGLSLGSILLLAAIGLSITFGVMGVINMAHGEMIMLGAYATYVVQQLFVGHLPASWLDAYLVVSLPVAFVVTGMLGIALERSVIHFLYARPLETLLATWGVSLILQQLVRTIFGSPNKAVDNPSYMTGGFESDRRCLYHLEPAGNFDLLFLRARRLGLGAKAHQLWPAHARGDPESRHGGSDGHSDRAR